MPPARLDAALAGVVESCVNAVGVDLNTASPSLLGHIAGINAAIAKMQSENKIDEFIAAADELSGVAVEVTADAPAA